MERKAKAILQEHTATFACQCMSRLLWTTLKPYKQTLITSTTFITVEFATRSCTSTKKLWMTLLKKLDFPVALHPTSSGDTAMTQWDS